MNARVTKPHASRKPRRRLRAERLEDRCLLTTIGELPVLFILVENGTGYEHDFHPDHSVAAYRGLLDGSDGSGAPVNVGAINLSDTPGGNQGRFAGDAAFPRTGGDHFALQAAASLYVPSGFEGTYTFGVNSDDGSRLRIDGSSPIVDDATHPPQDRFGTMFLAAGIHSLELTYFEYVLGATVELFIAPGTHAAWNASFQLLGSTAGSGPFAIGGFRVRQRSSNATIASLGNADALLAEPYHNVVDYFKENSVGKLKLVPASNGETHGQADGIIGPLERLIPATSPEATRRSALELADPYFDYARYDANHDGQISHNELAVVVVGGDVNHNWHQATVLDASLFVPGSFFRQTVVDPATNLHYDRVYGALLSPPGAVTLYQYQYYAHAGGNWDFWTSPAAQTHAANNGISQFRTAIDGANTRTLDRAVPADGIQLLPCQNAACDPGILVAGLGQWIDFMTVVHEISHLLSNQAYDLYNYEQFGVATGINRYATMGVGRDGTVHHDPWSKTRFAWIAPTLATQPGWYSLPAVEQSGQVLRIQRNADEYFLVENRWKGTSYDGTATALREIPGFPDIGLFDEGLAIWHVDETELPAFLTANGTPEHPFTEPPFIRKVDAGAAANSFDDLWDGSKMFSAISTPNTAWNDGAVSDIVVSAISAPGPVVTFHLDFTGVPRDLSEPNDSFELARSIGSGDRTLANLSIHRGNDDYYRWVALADGATLVRIDFDDAQGDLDLYVYRDDPLRTPVGVSAGGTNSEAISVAAEAGQAYFIKVVGYNNALNPNYTLTVDGPEAPGDYLESNDTLATAGNLGTGNRTETGLSIHAPGNEDYFRWFAPGVGSALVTVNFQHALGDVDLAVYDHAGTLLASSTGTGNSEQVTVPNVVPGEEFFIRVYGYAGAVNPAYDLAIDGPAIESDYLEPNDCTLGGARHLGTGDRSYANLALESVGAADCYLWHAPADGLLTVDVEFRHDVGDLDVQVFDSAWNLLGESTSTDDDERVELVVRRGQTYFIDVYGYRDAMHYDYRLSLDGPDVPADAYEPNDGFVQAALLGTGNVSLADLTIQDIYGRDFYRWISPANGDLAVDIAFDHQVGGLDLYLFDATQNEIGRSTGSGDTESVVVHNVVRGQSYYLLVQAQAFQDAYDLHIVGPPLLPDALETNDSREFARQTASGNITLSNLTLHSSTDADYFRWVSPDNGPVAVDLSFEHDAGDVDLFVFDEFGSLLGASTSTGDLEHVSLAAVARGQAIYVLAEGYGGVLQYAYRLSIDGPDVPADRFENNDSFDAAASLGAGDRVESDLTIDAPFDDDYFRWTPGAAGPANVSVYFQHSTGDVDLALYSSDRQLLAASTSTADVETIAFAAVAGRSYYVRVYGFSGARQWNYALSVDAPLRGDLDGDGAVGLHDAALVQIQLGSNGSSLAADLNGDGAVNRSDAAILAREYGRLGSALRTGTTAAAAALSARRRSVVDLVVDLVVGEALANDRSGGHRLLASVARRNRQPAARSPRSTFFANGDEIP